MKRSHVDFLNMEATIYLKGKGKKKRPHTFPLTDRMADIIREQPAVPNCDYVFTYRCERGGKKGEKDGEVIIRVRGQRYPFSSTGWTRRWSRARKDAGIEDFRFHDLRHTNATRIVRATGNLKVAQNLLGHTSISTTARYAHAFKSDIVAAMEKAEAKRAENAEKVARMRGKNVIPMRKIS